MISSAQVAFIIALSSSLVRGFSPEFSTPRQCSPLSISWTSISLPISPVALTEITLSLVPLENHSHVAPRPYMLAVPCGEAESGQVEIPRLPFPAGTQFFASTYIPGLSGPVRRTVSKVFTVEHSSDTSCLEDHSATLDKRAKAFGKRQISVIGADTVNVIPGDSTSAVATPPAATSTSAAAINVIGVGAIPASDSGATPASNSAAAPSSTGASPPINVIGTSQVSASEGVDTPGNAAPAPSASGPVPAIQVIGTTFVTATAALDASVTATASATDSAFVPNFTTVDVDSDSTSTSCTSTWSEPPMITETTTPCTSTWTTTTTSCTDSPTETPMMESMQNEDMSTMTTSMVDDMQSSSSEMEDGNGMNDDDMSSEQPCTTEALGMDSSNPSMDSMMPSDDTSSVASPTGNYYDDSSAVQYGSFDDMVAAANSMFHAWNPYKPAYTPST